MGPRIFLEVIFPVHFAICILRSLGLLVFLDDGGSSS